MKPLLDRILSRATPYGSCLVLGRAESSQRYWSVSYNGKRIGAHRAIYQLIRGDVDHSTEICHTCDNPRCVNIDHLFAAPHLFNMEDRNRKGRAAGPRKPRIAKEQVVSAYQMRQAGASVRDVASFLNIHPDGASQILNGRRWPKIYAEHFASQ